MSFHHKEQSMNREAAILAAMPKATLAEQRLLAQELEAIRSQRRTAQRQEREVNFADAVIRDTLTPVVPATRHTAATDWLDEVVVERPSFDLHAQAKAEATVWTKRVAAFVKEDRDEFTEQANGAARKWASQFGLQATAARDAFVAQALHLAGFRRQASDGAVSIAREDGTIVHTQVFPDEAAQIIADNPGWYIVTGTGSRRASRKHAGPMFPGAGAQVYYNDAGEPLGWDDAPYEPDPNDEYDNEMLSAPDEEDWELGYEVGGQDAKNRDMAVSWSPREGFDHANEGYVSDGWVRGYIDGWENNGGSESEIKPLRKNLGKNASRKQASSWRSGSGNSPWGSVQQRRDSDTYPGVFQVSTAGHGGVYVPNKYLNLIPADVQQVMGDQWSGSVNWYEEDLAIHAPLAYLPGLCQEWYPDYSADRSMAKVKSEMSDETTASRKQAGYGWEDSDNYDDDEMSIARAEARGEQEYDEGYETGKSNVRDYGEVRVNFANGGFDYNGFKEVDTLWVSGYADGWIAAGGDEAEINALIANFDKKKASRRTAAVRKVAARPLYEIADDIRRDWKSVYFGAVPYLEAMQQLDSIEDMYYSDSARTIVSYFLSNTRGWSGPKAAELKAELRAMVKGKSAAKGEFNPEDWMSGREIKDDIPSSQRPHPYGMSADEVNEWMNEDDGGKKKSSRRIAGATFVMTKSHPATGYAIYDIYELSDGRYAHVYNGPMVDNPRINIYRTEGGIGQLERTIPLAGDDVESILAQASRRTAAILYDAETGEEIGVATEEQAAASFSSKAGDTGGILIDADGDVVDDGTWEAQQPGVRLVYVASRRTADQGFGPSADSQDGEAESSLPMVTVDSAPESFGLGWAEDDMDDAPEAYEKATDGLDPFGAKRRTVAGPYVKSYDIVGYTYRGENYTPEGVIEALLADGMASPAARDMNPEDVLDQVAGANGIDREDEYSFDSDEFPKVILADMYPGDLVDENGRYVTATLRRKAAREAFPRVTDAQAQKFVDIASQVGYDISRDQAHDILLLSGGFEAAMDQANIVEDVYNDVRGYGELDPEKGFGVSMLIETTDYLGWVSNYEGEKTLEECQKMLGMLRTESQKKAMRRYINNRFGVTASRKTAMPSPAEAGVKVGDIFYNSWGYDQTNVNFYEVIRLTGQGVEVQPIHSRVVSSSLGSESVVPSPGHVREFDVILGVNRGDTKRTKVCRLRDGWGGTPRIVLSRDYSAEKWDGRPLHQTDAYSGH